MKQYTEQELNKLSTKRLLSHFRFVSNHLDEIYRWYGARCCELCMEYIGEDWEKDVGQYAKPVKEYRDLVKAILNTREHVIRKQPQAPNTKKIKLYTKTRGRGKFKELPKYRKKSTMTIGRYIGRT